MPCVPGGANPSQKYNQGKKKIEIRTKKNNNEDKKLKAGLACEQGTWDKINGRSQSAAKRVSRNRSRRAQKLQST